MEYDRALYRVYERIIEDLNMSSDPMETSAAYSYNGALSSPSSSVRSRGSRSLRHRRRTRRGVSSSAEEDGSLQHGDNDNSSVDNTNNSNIEEPPPSISPTSSSNSNNRRLRRRRRAARQNRESQQQQQQQQQQHQIPSGLTTSRRVHSQTLSLPFIVPIWMAKKIDAMNNNRSSNQNLTGGRVNISNILASPDRAATSYGYINEAWRSFRNALLLGRGHSTYESVATTTAQQLSIYQYSPQSHSNLHRYNDDNFGQSTPPRDVEQMQLGEEGWLSLPILEDGSNGQSPSSRSSEGLRRRASPSTPTRGTPSSTSSPTGSSGSPSSPSRRSTPPYIPNPPDISQATSSTTSPVFVSAAAVSPGGERTAPISPPTVSLTQRAIQLQMRQAQLHSRGSSEMEINSDSDGYDSDELSNGDESSAGDDSSSTSSSNAENERNDTGCSRKNVYGMMRISFALGVFHLFALVALHVTYVGPYAFRKPGMSRLSYVRQRVKRSLVSHLDILGNFGGGVAFLRKLLEDGTKKNVNTADEALVNCIQYALSTRPENERSKYYTTFGDGDSMRTLMSVDIVGDDIVGDDFVGDDFGEVKPLLTHHHHRRRFIPDAESKSSEATPLLGKDEILQIKIMFGVTCTGQCSRVRRVNYGNITRQDKIEQVRWLDQDYRRGSPFLRATRNRRTVLQSGEDIYSSPEYWDKPHYKFSMDDALLYIDDKTAKLHNITNVNVTVTERCLSTGRDDGKLSFFTAIGEFLAQIYGMDSVIINQLMYGIRGSAGSLQSGYMLNAETKERWGWTKQQLQSFEGSDSFSDWVLKKMGVLAMSLLAFFLVTTVTSLIVRVLTSSGVVLMFPLFAFFRSIGMSGADERILAMSYPWIGTARAAIANRQIHPQSHLICAHVSKILLYYIMYEACQAAWSAVLYAKSIPEALPVWIYGMAMILEYFCMVFVRSALSAHFFPRICLLYLLAYHLYFYAVPYGFFDVALIPLFLFLLHSMLYTILAFEVPSAASGVISVETPREVYNKLSWPEWSAQLPSEWTIFLPLNARNTPIHDRVTDEVNGSQPNATAQTGT